MEEKKSARQAGSKVSQIANIFQGSRQPNNIREEILTPVKVVKTRGEKEAMESPSVTVMRTESHVTRFNNARALFEKLGEENRGRVDRMVPLQSTKSASNILDLRSRSSSANSETRDTKSHDGSRSPSPNRNQLDKFSSNSVPVLNANANVKTNGFNNSSQLPDNALNESVTVKLNGNNDVVVKCSNTSSEERTNNTKPMVMKKPEKPERKFNTKDLIEKQRNWTSHFSKTRSSRYNSDPSKTDVKFAVSNGSKENSNDNQKNNSASRSASFNNRIRSPPTSPPPPPDVTRRPNVVRRERPASVIPTTAPPKKEFSSLTSTVKPVTSPTRREKTTSLIFTKEDSPTSERVITTNTYRVTKPHFKRDDKDNKENECETKTDNRVDYVSSPTKSTSRSSSQDSLLQPVVTNIANNKSVSEEKETSRENLSATSGSLSSLSPPSSPSRVKTENEKQEDESNEKSDIPEQPDATKQNEKTETTAPVTKRTKISSISLNIPAAGLGSRPPSVVSTSTLDEGGFNEPYPEIKAKLKPHEDGDYNSPTTQNQEDENEHQPYPVEHQRVVSPDLLKTYETDSSSSCMKMTSSYSKLHSVDSNVSSPSGNITPSLMMDASPKSLDLTSPDPKAIEALYAVPHKLNNLTKQRSNTSTDSEVSQVTIIPQHSIDSDIIYNNQTIVITNSVLAELESRDSVEKSCSEFLRNERIVEGSCRPDLISSTIEYTKKPMLSPEIKSEANILDLNDVDYADASDEDQDNELQQEQSEADAMTPAEAENLLSSKQDLLSDEEAQEVTRLLHHDDTRHWQPDPTSSFMQDSTSIQDGSMGPPSLNDSMGPPSLQEDSITEPVVEYAVVNKAHKLDHTKNFISSSLMNESTSSIDVSTQDFDGMSASMSKMDSSVASDSGLIGKKFCENSIDDICKHI
ncbi:hypothetical protein MML48_1g11233 [Holotrichia oblita]|uniref:Uncharacterized protein n=1 Tax=Holotrichia oblita TaxID=644536 RepID=A0ACB9TSV5_HOLOL|nr:hypothetical protein MML48_1g11233 [Holotrichia oblita]